MKEVFFITIFLTFAAHANAMVFNCNEAFIKKNETRIQENKVQKNQPETAEKTQTQKDETTIVEPGLSEELTKLKSLWKERRLGLTLV